MKSAKVAHFCSMCGPQFCSMKISQDVRGFAATQGVDEQVAPQKGMEQKSEWLSEWFVKQGGQLYSKV